MADIIQALVSILLFLDSLIYSLINWVYQIILILCQVDILNNTFEVQGLINRLYVIIGVVVLFVVAYSLLRSMVNPDDAIKGKKSPVTIIRDVLISIVAIALVPTIFSVASRFQNAILLENTIGKIILGDTINAGDATYDSDETVRNGGMEIASNVLRAFLHPVYSECNLVGSEYDCSNVKVNTMGVGIPFIFSIPVVSDNYDDIWQEIYDSGNFLNITIFSYSIAHDGNITYYYLISTLVGAFVLLVLLSYCIDIAIRTIKLAVYQLIAPLPILARIAPGEQGSKIFSNWLKATISTYLEVFIRLAILFFAVLMVKLVVQNLPTLLIGGGFISGNAGFTVYLFAQLFLIVGIILFVKQAPGLIKEITGLDGGKYNVFGSAMKSLNTLRTLPKVASQTWNNTNDNPNRGKVWNTANRLKNALLSAGKGVVDNHEAEYKGLGDLNKNYDKITTENLSERRRKEAIRKAKLNRKDRYKREPGLKSQDRAAAIHEYFHGSVDTRAIEEKIKLANSVGKDIKSKIIDEAIDKNLRVKQLDNAWKTLQNKAVDTNDYFERVTADNYAKLGLTLNDVGSYYDATSGNALDYGTAYNEARKRKEAQEGALKKERDNAAFETMWGAVNGDFSVFDVGDVDSIEKQEFVREFFTNLQSQFNENIEYAKAKNSDIAGSKRLSARIDVTTMSSAKDLKDAVGERKLEADTLATGYDKDLAGVRSREQLKAEIKGDKK